MRLTRRRLLTIVAVVLVAGPAVAYAVLALQTSDAPAPAALPTRSAPPAGPSGPLAGSWAVSAEAHDFVGYRVREKLGPLPAPDDAVGRTRVVSGRLTVAGEQIASARIRADLASLKSDAAPRDGALRHDGLELERFPTATFVLAKPLALGHPQRGRVMRLRALGLLTLHGVTRNVEVALAARWNGDSLDVAGQTPIRLADFRMTMAQRLGLKIADHGTMEFALTFRRPAHARPAPEPSSAPRVGGPPEQPPVDRRELAREPVAHGAGRLLVTAGRPDDLADAYRMRADGTHPQRIAPRPRSSAGTPNVLTVAPERSGASALIARQLVPDDSDPSPPRIYRIDLAAPRLQPLTPSGVRAEMPAVSPSGDRFVYARGDGTSDALRLYVARRDGSGARALPRVGSSDDAPSWSPDGTRIAFTCFGADEDICVVRPDGGGARRLTHGPGYDAQPAWSPDGRRVAFSRDGDIWTMDGAGRHLRRLTRGARLRDTAPAWSPDGERIAFIRADARPDSTFAGPGRVMLMRSGGQGLARVKTRLPSVQFVAWQP